jgi:hypothetical protein
MKLITTLPLERYDVAAERTPECAAAERDSPEYCDAII